MTIRDMEIFSTVVACGTMSGAAREQRISQSSVSQVITEIEREYGILLFERYGRKLRLTPTGETLLDYVQKTLRLLREMDGFLRSDPCESTLRIGASVTVGGYVLCPLLEQFQALCPRVRTEVLVANTHEVEEKLLSGDLDIGLVEGVVTHPDLTVEEVMDDRLVLICGRGHPFFGRTEVELRELGGQALIVREAGSGTRAQLEEALAQNKVSGDIRWVCSSTEAIQNAVASNFGVSVLSPRIVRDRCRRGILWACRIEDADLGRKFSLICHKNKYMSDVLLRFRAICLEFCQEGGLVPVAGDRVPPP